MNKLVRMILALAMASLLSACVVNPVVDYRPPEGEQTAKLVMRGSVGQGEAYNVYLFANAESCSGMQRVGVGTAANDPATVRIDATRLVTMDVMFTRFDRTYCRVRWSFSPKPGRTYLVRGKNLADRCWAMVMDASDPDRIVVEASSRRRDTGGRWCVPMAETAPIKTDQARETEEGLPGTTQTRTDDAPRLNEKASDDDLKGLIGGKQ